MSQSKLPLEMMTARLFNAPDAVCLERARLVTEAWQTHADQPIVMRRACALAHVLKHMTLDLQTNPIFAGNTSSRPRAWMLLPEYGLQVDSQIIIEHNEFEGFLDDQIPDELRAFWQDQCLSSHGLSGSGGEGHLSVNYDAVVNIGLAEICKQFSDAGKTDSPEQATYRRAMQLTLEAVIAWAHRYAIHADQMAKQTGDATEQRWHRRVGEACRHVPEYSARNLFEGLQAIALVHLALAIEGQAMSLSVGLPDRVLARFAEEASSDPEAAGQLVAAFLLKLASNAIYGKASKTQAVTIGGADHEGRDCCNAITRAFLDGYDLVPVYDPHLFLRWHDQLDVNVARRSAAMLARGRSMPLLINDHPTTIGLINAGIEPCDAWHYCMIGCNELGIPGRLFDTATPQQASYNDLALLNQLLLNTDAQTLDGWTSKQALEAALHEIYSQRFQSVLTRRQSRKEQVARLMPCPLTTALMNQGVVHAQDYMTAMSYQTPCVYTRGLANAANALVAIETLVFKNKTYRLSALVEAMRDDLPDAEMNQCLADSPKWGNDDDHADRWALRLIALRNRAMQETEQAMGLPHHTVCHVVRSLHHVDGRNISASLDGRKAGTPVGDSIGAICGTARQGPTAMLNSVLKINAARDFDAGYNLNLTLASGQATTSVVHALIQAFFSDGGQELQLNVFDVSQLEAAREHPEQFSDLVVRVAGLSARFIDLSDMEQLELIDRAKCVDMA